jgi:hypothetical protein
VAGRDERRKRSAHPAQVANALLQIIEARLRNPPNRGPVLWRHMAKGQELTDIIEGQSQFLRALHEAHDPDVLVTVRPIP